MSPADEQRITTTYSLNVTQKKAIAQFSAPIQNLVMSPPEAVQMAQILLSCAKELEPEAVIGHTWPGMADQVRTAPLPAVPAGKPS